MSVIVSAMKASDWADVSRIYQEGIDTGDATFEGRPPASWECWCRGKINSCSLVARDNDQTVGWAALSPVSSRAAYAGVAEVSVYVGWQARGKGIGSVLLRELIGVSEGNGIWTLQAGIFSENQSSLRLHVKHGFQVVGVRRRLSRMEYGPHEGRWRDVVLLERHSSVVGM